MLEVELPYPPSINTYWRRAGARIHISKNGIRFRERVIHILRPLDLEPLRGPVWVTVEVFPPDKRRRDIDNLQKALFDALKHGGVYEDDSQISFFSVARMGVVPGGKVVVKIQEQELQRGV